ncbi:Bax inhibitor-1 family protein [Tumidithrix elongata RA019]|uniref:Bax inhibitor-1 family protein n=1 Tax=Tumidithrix elongata BACA0141 TaxID=2716417 RepID=A0AAW9Q7T4_9CYAN|nr:Bax inhibitor-1 family protein [Tumidithrix elongata RA019]
MVLVAQASQSERTLFIQRTYGHLAGAVAAFTLLEFAFLNSPLAGMMLNLLSANRYMWLLLLGGFALLGWLARELASRTSSLQSQYLGLGFYVIAEAIIFVPLLFIAIHFSSPSVLPNAVVLTGVMFAGLTAIAFTTRQDFSFLRGALTMGGFIALGLILCSIMFGFSLGLWFSLAMVVFACAAILYDTSNIIHHFSTEQYVAASLELFASVALLFWYILRILMEFNRR